MSFTHILLKRTEETENSVHYVAESPDFNDDGAWKSVAHIVIDKTAADYEFYPMNEWMAMKLVQPKLYALSEEERSARLEEGAGCGAWTGRIHAWVTRLIAKRDYPAAYPT
jgi:hypothetical protein